MLALSQQWLATTSGRIATDGFSWLQAVCWFRLDGGYRAPRGHGPRRVGDTTLRVATELARLSPCRPGVSYLMHRLQLSKRTVQYHLGILRETGLLTYRAKGTRVSGRGGMASEFEWTIPTTFDTAVHLRTRTSEQYGRIVRGIEDQGRALMKRLSRMAQRLMRRRLRRPSTRRRHCTPMEGSSESSATTGTTSVPPESNRVSGNAMVPHSQKPTPATRRKLNKVGRRFQLARELIGQIDWLTRCSVPRIAWVVRNVADAGWSATDVRAWLHLRGGSTQVRRPSGLLAVLLSGAETTLDTPAKRTYAADRWHAAQEAARLHRIESVRRDREQRDGDWRPPVSTAVQRLVADAFAAVTPQHGIGEDLPEVAGPQDLTAEELQVMRNAARGSFMSGDTGLVMCALEAFGRPTAEALYGPDLVERAIKLADGSSLMVLGRQ
ncbi:helix-turn-helix domain-containing protein [Streptomyces kanamyceticus]|uniref:helix-turn-helix domain-containing protein n=1 Tax=Streptomyces kanamyceticus TaxID=1967 RepID=UPI0006E41E6A|nr:helix-turn-helix domain-containing protein [Streptomyces kanamyceticus]